jgi:hypothetical protein
MLVVLWNERDPAESLLRNAKQMMAEEPIRSVLILNWMSAY